MVSMSLLLVLICIFVFFQNTFFKLTEVLQTAVVGIIDHEKENKPFTNHEGTII